MNTFLQPFRNMAEFEDIRKKIQKGKGILQISGCVDAQKAHLAFGLSDLSGMKLIIAESDLKAKQFYEDYTFYDPEAVLYPSRDLIFYQSDIQGNVVIRQRIQALRALIEQERITMITSISACMEDMLPLETFAQHILHIDFEHPVDQEELKEQLIYMGYERVSQVDMPGQFSVRGGIIDIYDLTNENPVRIELFDTDVDMIRYFDPESQRSLNEELEEFTIYPAGEMILTQDLLKKGIRRIRKASESAVKAFRDVFKTEEGSRLKQKTAEACEQMENFQDFHGAESYIRYFYPKDNSLLDYFLTDSLCILDEPNHVSENALVLEEEFRETMSHRLEGGYSLPEQADILLPFAKVQEKIQKRRTVSFSAIEPLQDKWRFSEKYSLQVQAVSSFNSSFDMLVKDFQKYKKEGYGAVLLSPSRTRAMRLAEDLQQEGLNGIYSENRERELQPGEIMVCCGNVSRGFSYPMLKFVVITETDIFGREKTRKKKRKKSEYSGKAIQNFTQLHSGDYVVHENHGLGIFRGIEKVTVDGIVKDYLKIEYDGRSCLYMPTTSLDMLQKYADADAKKPALNKLGGQEWKKTKTKVRSAVKDIAHDLVQLYSARQQTNGFVYGPDTVWQREFEELFPYEETEDQLSAIEATKQDMESTKIMDRLICGDVGFGKTEIAIRAAFKAVQENKQVVYLVPTTILAQQHYNTFVQRMKDYPVNIDLLCRFRSAAQQKKTVEKLKKGLVDIVIGTHRVLSKDVQFKDLGLLIIDEEQRFGVSHKEKIKQLRNNIDVLALTATPIPRTLHMSLIGIRDMSILEEAPLDRVPIQTYVMEYSQEMVREAIHREMARGGQVYYVYNRVKDIAEVASAIARQVPEANVVSAHGQMSERELEKIMYDFINGDIDVLVTTTIIETGLDISNVNTIIIHDSDRMGLSQLYQLRGRVGRTNRTAYAFLMYRRNKVLKEVAEKRLAAIREFTDLGSGFKIAMRDLEIRGAGNLLGAEQSGHMEAVGYDLYCKMLNEAVREEKGEVLQDDFETTMDLSVNAYIPEHYIANEHQKLDIYKRIACIETQEEYGEMLDELIDRFGTPPKAVQNLLAVAKIKALAHKVYVSEVKQIGGEIQIYMYEQARIHTERISELMELHRNRLFIKANPPRAYFQYIAAGKNIRDTSPVTEQLEKLFTEMVALLPE